MNQRELAYKVLKESIVDKKYTNLLLRNELNKLKPIQRPFVLNLVNGVLRHYDYLLYQISDLVDSSIKTKNKIIICMALYEKFYFNEKDYVINNEYVSLANNYDKGFINALLHHINEFKEIKGEDDESLAIKYSLPLWIFKLIKSQYKDNYLDIISSFNKESNVYYHLNKGINYDDLKNLKINIINEHMFTSDDYLLNSDEYQKGYFYIQDINNSEIINYLDLNEENTFLDVCSAPGSKLFNALEYIKEENAYSNDLYEHRLELIKNNALRLGYKNINYLNYDATTLSKNIDMKFDRILIDAPCSGLGVLKRKPDLKFHISSSSLDELEKVQKEILNDVKKLLNTNGIMVYSTCTLNKKENNKQIERFIKENNDFILMEEKTILDEMGDYFYLAKLKKV